MEELNMSLFNKGDRVAFNQVFDKYHKPLANFAFTIIRDKEDAKDIVLETFTKLYKICDNFKTPMNIQAFMYITTKNACFNYLKANKRRIDLANRYASLDHNLPADSMESILEDEERTKQLHLLVNQLPTKNQEFVRLMLAGMTNDEIAARLDTTPNNVASHIRNAGKMLLNLLKNNLLRLPE